jgi:hypothetical protein
MRYNVNLGLLAVDAMSVLTKAEARGDDELYRTFLERSAEFCRSVRDSYDRLQVDLGGLPQPAGSFLSAVMRREQERSPHASPKLEAVDALEPFITSILEAKRAPTPDERLKIAKALYETSAADPT